MLDIKAIQLAQRRARAKALGMTVEQFDARVETERDKQRAIYRARTDVVHCRDVLTRRAARNGSFIAWHGI